ncbi:MAG: hypothetical protein R3D78_03735 [Paracoccaceae bacterium]|jgi:hypothetical protein
MNTQISIGLAALIFLALGVDAMAFDGQGSLFLAGKMVDLIQYVAFWR